MLVKIPASEIEQQKLNLLAFHKHVEFNPEGKLVVSQRHAHFAGDDISASDLFEKIYGSGNEALFQKVTVQHVCREQGRRRRISPWESPNRPWLTDRRF